MTEEPETTDAEIRSVCAKDRDAAATLLVRAHGQALGCFCMALLGSQSEAEVALRETLAEALEELPSWNGRTSVRVWLASLARQRCARRVEGRSRKRTEEASLGAPESLPAPQRARRLLAELKPTEREALVLRFGVELDLRDVAQACGVDEAAARQRVSRGISRISSLKRAEET